MNVSGPILCTCLAFLLISPGCSKKEEPPVPAERPKVVKRIIRPPRPVKVAPAPLANAEQAGSPLRSKDEPPRERTSQDVQSPRPEEKPAAAVKTVAPAKASPPPPKIAGVDMTGAQKEEGLYVVEKNDSLIRIAGKESVYGDPLKWTILCRTSMDKLAQLATGAVFPERRLPAGMTLKILLPEEARKNLKERPRNYWIVNVVSSPSKERIVPAAIKLLKEAYPVYITTVDVKGKEWMRLRVGFFKSKAEAELEGKKITALLGFPDLWITKIGDREFEEFGGY